MEVVLISCVSKKREQRCKAKDMYVSTWFAYAWRYAQSRKPGRIFILSAKYGLVNPKTEIDPYQETLNTKTDREIQEWARGVVNSLREETDVERDTFIILAGEKYRRHLVDTITRHEVPMERKRIGEQLKWLKEQVDP